MLNFELSTFIFQGINFFVLLGVLTYFFYRPVLRVMKKRQEDVDSRLKDADEQTRKAEEERRQLAEEKHQARKAADALLARGKSDAAKARQEILDRARQEAASMLEEARQRIREQQRVALRSTEERLREAAISISETLLQQAVGPELHSVLMDSMLRKERLGLSPDQATLLHRALESSGGRVTVETAYPPEPGLMDRLAQSIAEIAGVDRTSLVADSRVEPSLLAGVRILVNTVAVDLSLRHTLGQLGRRPRSVEETD